MAKRKCAPVVLLVTAFVILSGCGIGGENTKETIDPPPKVNLVEEGQSLKNKEKKENSTNTEKLVERELYLLDQSGKVVPKVLKLPATKSVAKQSLQYLVKDGPVANILPNGFQAVLPPGTEVLSVNMIDDTIIADFSKEFNNYKPKEEEKILQSITYTLTQFDKVKKVKIRINGHDVDTMPVNHTPIQQGVSRMDGINFENGEVNDVTNTKPLVVYFLAQNNREKYLVPVTRRINEEKDAVTAAVEELVKGPLTESGLLTEFREEVKLVSKPKYENGVVTLNFNEAILTEKQGKAISDDVVRALVLTLTEQAGIEKVSIMVNGKEQVQQVSGNVLSKPVMRPKNVNTGTF